MSNIRSLFTVPTLFEDDQKSQTAQNLYVILMILFVGISPLLVIDLVQGASLAKSLPVLFVELFALLGLVLVRRGIVYSYSWGLIFGAVAWLLLRALQAGGSNSTGLAAIPAIIVVSVIVLGMRGTLVMMAFSIIGIITLGWATATGKLPPQDMQPVPTLVVLQIAYLLITTGALYVSNRNLSRMFSKVEEERDQNKVLNEQLAQAMLAERELRETLQVAVSQYTAFTQGVAQGDLTTRLTLSEVDGAATSDLFRLGNSLNEMAESLAVLTGQTREAIRQLSGTSQELLAMTNQQAASVSEQQATVTQTTATVEEVKTTVQQTAERAQSVTDAAHNAVQISQAGEDSVVRTIDGMERVQSRVQDIAVNILALSEQTQQIGEIITTVDNIAYQSKLLAFNASIEAARAGEEGRGFSVVANEVRELADQSQQATAHVSDILHEIQQATNTAVMVTEEGIKETASGMTLAGEAGEAIREMAGTIELAAQSAQQISASAQQQNTGMEQLLSAIQTIESVSVQTVQSTEQAKESARTLTDIANDMEQTITRYRLE